MLVPAHDKNALELIDMYACSIDAKACSTVMGGLAAAAPLRGALGHVKRVRRPRDIPNRLDIILCPLHREDALEESEEEGEKAQPMQDDGAAGFHTAATAHPGDDFPLELLPQAVVDIIKGRCERIFVVQVARYPPRSKEDQATWGRHWPVTVRPPDKLARRDAVELTPEEAEVMQRHMAAAWSLAGGENGGNSGSACCAARNACVIVDPENDAENGGRVVGTGVDASNVHPLHHAVMGAVEAVARWQRRTWYGEQSSDNDEEEEDRSVREEEAKRRRVEESDEAGGVLQSNTVKEEESIPPYLCTEYDCYVVREPCAMCAMALVHSRARRVVFCLEDPAGGALGGSGLKLHSKRTLNHHYIVYKMSLIE
jgi:tRNA(Arg) A34 adenosine deaminase TadA